MEKIDSKSLDERKENLNKLREIFPETFSSSEFDINKLLNIIGITKSLDDEKYGFLWNGKTESIINSQVPTQSTLLPIKEKSLKWNNTQNIYIEGDNLEVLKILQKSYNKKINMIYIDPPYNTGNDFVYKDDFKNSIMNYKNITNQMNRANSETEGRYHTDWLNMIYPRLRLSKNLLSDSGVIFISIDDNEYANLKKICDEIYGENNYVGTITWSKKRKGSFLSKGIISLTEYILCYSKNFNAFKGLFGGKADSNESQPIIKRTNKKSVLQIKKRQIKFKLEDGIYKSGVYGDDVNPIELIDDVIVENGVNLNDFRILAPFTWSQRMYDTEIEKGTQPVINTKNFQIRVFRKYGEESFKGFPSLVTGIQHNATNEDAYEELLKIFNNKKVFDYSKPSNLIQLLLETISYFDKDSIILDFFSGSATTACACMKTNIKNNTNLKYILVQLPEKCDDSSIAYEEGFKTICDIGEERIRRASIILKEENGILLPEYDDGFKVFKLDSSNIKIWNGNELTINNANEYFYEHVDSIVEGRTNEDLLYEILLKEGIILSTQIEEKEISGKKIYSIGLGYMIICLDDNIDIELVRSIGKLRPETIIFKDLGFVDENAKANALQELKKLGIDEQKVKSI